jgi:hypothetical protein
VGPCFDGVEVVVGPLLCRVICLGYGCIVWASCDYEQELADKVQVLCFESDLHLGFRVCETTENKGRVNESQVGSD